MRALLLSSVALLALAASAGCTQGRSSGGDGGVRADTGTGGCTTEGEILCMGNVATRCVGGTPVTVATCTADQVCAPGLGCAACVPGQLSCDGNTPALCRPDGSGTDLQGVCAADQMCRNGSCVDACALAEVDRSNVGCEYWAVDLDNEYAETLLGVNDAAGAQFAVAVANPNDRDVLVQVERNTAPLGSAPTPQVVFAGMVGPRSVLEIQLDPREVDGSTMRDDGPGTFVSPNAYRISTNFPVVAYQFNPIIQQFSNDASLLIPTTGLDTFYRVLGWPTANPIAPFPMPGLPDHSYVTIVGVTEATEVTVTLGGAIVAGGGVPATAAGGTVTYTLGPYDVLNLESDGIPGDMSGTTVSSTAPVVVFTGGERGIAPYGEGSVPDPPGGWPDNVCCTDHLEEQVFPTSAWGRDFVLTHSPQRSDTSWVEPDIYRVMADRETTTITTNLGGDFATITLAPGEWRELYAQRSFVMRADHPIQIEQILVSQQFMPSYRPNAGGDPSMLLFPPYQQYRNLYAFLAPSTWAENYVVFSAPVGTVTLLDGRDIRGTEFESLCTYEDAGDLDGVVYQAITCPVDPGSHVVEGDIPVGIMIYGYYNVGSYGYAGGSDLERINVF
jgi:hypothetical protein